MSSKKDKSEQIITNYGMVVASILPETMAKIRIFKVQEEV
jgi:hypothetical protein